MRPIPQPRTAPPGSPRRARDPAGEWQWTSGGGFYRGRPPGTCTHPTNPIRYPGRPGVGAADEKENGLMGAEGAAVVAEQIAQAIKASGAIVRVEPDDFLRILARSADPLVISALGGYLSGGHDYLTSYKGIGFFTNSPRPLTLPGGAEIVAAQKIWIPS